MIKTAANWIMQHPRIRKRVEAHPNVKKFIKHSYLLSTYLWGKFNDLMTCWCTALVLALLTLSLGALLSMHPAEIGTPLNDWLAKRIQFSDLYESITKGDAAIFFGLLILFALLFGFRETALARIVRSKEIELMTTIRTMPPRKMLYIFRLTYDNILQYINAKVHAEGNPLHKATQIDRAIRLCLDSITVLTKEFQRSGKGSRYAANIMLYIDANNIGEEDQPTILEKMDRFVDIKTLDGLQGVLELASDLSASTDNSDDSFDKDEYLDEMCLPVPCEAFSRHNKLQRFLPGAPEALINGNYLINDTHRLLEHYDESRKYDIPRSIFENGDYYFRKTDNGRRVRSFFSVALEGQRSGEIKKAALGVVNVHSSEPNIFPNDETFQSFLQLTYPFMRVLSDLLIQRQEHLERTEAAQSRQEQAPGAAQLETTPSGP